MNQLLESILLRDKDSYILKLGQPFSMTERMSDLGSNDWKSSWTNFKNGKLNVSDASYVWKNIDAVMDQIGNDVYSKILTYIDSISNIDLCGISQLYSMCQMVGHEDNLALLKYQYPLEIKELLDIFSINKNLLLNSDKVLKAASRETILSELSSSVSGIAHDDPRLTWDSDDPLIYISINSSDQSNGTYYKDYEVTDQFYSSNKRIKISNLEGDYFVSGQTSSVITNPEVAVITDTNGSDDAVSSISYDVSKIRSVWDGSSADGFVPFSDMMRVSDNSPGVFLGNLNNIKFTKTNGYGIVQEASRSRNISDYFGITYSNNVIKPIYYIDRAVPGQPTNYNIKAISNGLTDPDSVLYAATYSNPISECYFLPNTEAQTIHKVIEDLLAGSIEPPTIDLTDFNDFDIESLYPVVGYVPTSIQVQGGDASINGLYLLDQSNEITAKKITWTNSRNTITQTASYSSLSNEITTAMMVPGFCVDPNVESSEAASLIVFNSSYRNVANVTLISTDQIYNLKASSHIKNSPLHITLRYRSTGSFTGFELDITNSTGYYQSIYRAEMTDDFDASDIPETNWYLHYTNTNNESVLITDDQLNNLHFYRDPKCYNWTFTFGDIYPVTIPVDLQTSPEARYMILPPTDSFLVNNAYYIIASANAAGIRFVYPKDVNGIVAYWEKSMYELSVDTLTQDQYKAYIKSVYKKVLDYICKLPYREAEIKHEEDPSYEYTPSDLIYKNCYKRFNGDALFSSELVYDSDEDKAAMVNLKLNYNVPVTFNEQLEYDNILLGNKQIEDFSLGERLILEAENENREKARSAGNNVSKYYKLRENKVREYFRFILTFYAYSHQSDILTPGLLQDYKLDENYFLIGITDSTSSYINQSMYSGEDAEGYGIINEELIDSIAGSLAQASIDIATLRDRLKTDISKIYMKGTWNLIRDYIIEYVFTKIAPAIPELSSYLNSSFSVNLVEYTDNTEYFNIQSNDDQSYTSQERSRLNPKYWESADDRYITLDNLSDSEISSFYYNTLGLKLLDEDGIETKTDNALKTFLSVVYNAGAVTDRNNDYYVSIDTNFKDAVSKYAGTSIGKAPYYNYKNQSHPSYQLHQYIYNFAKYVYQRFSIENLFLNADAVYAEELQSNISSYIDEVGNVIEKWIAGRYDFTGYNSDYEDSNPFNNKYLRTDGPFNMYALNEYLADPESFIENHWTFYYTGAGVDSAEREITNTILTKPEVIQAIRDLSEKIIAKYVVDRYGNSITLYKDVDDKNVAGTLWFRPVGHALSFPMFIAEDGALSVNNFLKQYSGSEVDTILELCRKYQSGISFLPDIYDFELDRNQNYIALVVRKIQSSVELSSNATDILDVSAWNYANAFVTFFNIERTYDTNDYEYKYYIRVSTTNQTSRSYYPGLISSNGIDYLKQLCGTQVSGGYVYVQYINYPYKNGQLLQSDGSIVTRYNLPITLEKIDYSGTRSQSLNTELKVAYRMSSDRVAAGSLAYNPLNVCFSINDSKFNTTVEFNASDLQYSSRGQTYIVNYPGYYENYQKVINPSDSSITESTLYDEFFDFNLALLDKAYMTIEIDESLTDPTPTLTYYQSLSDNQFIPLFPASQGFTKLWNSPAISNLSSYTIQYIGKSLAATRDSRIFEQAKPNYDEETDAETYSISAYKALISENDEVSSFDAFTGYTTLTLDGQLSTGYYPLIATSAELLREEYADLYSKLGEGSVFTQNVAALQQSVLSPLNWKIPRLHNDDIGFSLSAYTWQTVEQTLLSDRDLSEMVPPATELEELNTIIVDQVLDTYNNYGIFELDQGYTIGITYIVVEDNSSPFVEGRSNVRLYDFNNPADRSIRFDLTDDKSIIDPEPKTKDLTISNSVGQLKNYRVQLISFAAGDLYKIKFRITRL